MDKILLTTGGTGGHIFPALAVAEEIRQRWPQAELLFVGSLYGPEQRLAARAGIPFEGLPVRGVLGRGLKAVAAGGRMAWAVCKALGIVRRFRPQVIVGFGGYAAFAPMLAGRLLGVPGVLHEQNAIAGASNRLLSRLARQVCLSLPQTEGFAHADCILTGNPVRQGVAAVGHQERDFSTRHLLIMGGSQGARAINRLVPGILPALRAAGVEVRHQAGPAGLEETRAAYAEAGHDPACVTAFIEDMPAAYAWADLALCRAGASTVAELCAAGLPAVLVPFPRAIHDHQTRNAEVMVQVGAALLIPEHTLAGAGLAELLPELLQDDTRRTAMSAAALGAARPDAAARVTDVVARIAAA